MYRSLTASTLHHRYLKYGLWAALAYGAGDMMVVDDATLRSHMKILGAGWKGVVAVKKAASQIGFDIDGRLDAMAPQEILGAGEVRLGGTASAFIKNPKILTPENWQNFKTLIDLGIMSEPEINAFFNLMAERVAKEAKAAAEYQKHPSASLRMEMAEEHLALNNVCFMFIVHILRHDKRVTDAIDKPMTLKDLTAIYPYTAKMGEIVQIQDDMQDVLFDLSEEVKSRRPSSNIVLAIMEKNGTLHDEKGELRADVSDFLARAQTNSEHFELGDMPHSMQTAILEAASRYRQQVGELKILVRGPLKGLLEATLHDGWSIKPEEKELLEIALRQQSMSARL